MHPRIYWKAHKRACRRARIAMTLFRFEVFQTESLWGYIKKHYRLTKLINDRAQREFGPKA